MKEKTWMRRCFELARLGAGRVSPNPMVGAVLVSDGRIIGEGYHQAYGEAHAEVNAIRSVIPEERDLISRSTLYVSLEPCCVYGKTPPCTDLIIRHEIPRVRVSCLDLSPQVSGKGIGLLREAGIDVQVGLLSEEGRKLASTRTTYVLRKRPYIILKFAVTSDGIFCPGDELQYWITQPATKRLVHRWRSECDAILVGRKTAIIDNPRLDNRHFHGPSPLRIVIDPRSTLTDEIELFSGDPPTLRFW
ncbi:MAG: bifunctional diaminohydroxyphosphoribosylaminopyrimidine deaminase/5-amino-6-(5-phosphoribosylamino)uracil reductase RibD, partial [Saprospiraceae bacterium]|nr:bifunctional diaminohydroxyphosphoribosylaminopyrimidine deaminase/5-amino-6-(5-phosphoribosylamino)uracil reductase RibD [Saprospiraceae bacterium]